MVQKLSVQAIEESSFTIPLTFYSAVTGDVVTPTAITWSLITTDGTVVNNRSNVSVTPVASSITILLNGDDLALSGNSDTRTRRVLIEATYDSSLGNGLSLKDEVVFTITPLVGVT